MIHTDVNNTRVLLLELNEINFEFVRYYADRGKLPNFRRLFELYGYKETTSEHDYEQLEPWIQWVSAHTGKTLAEHRVFRLGDIVNTDHEQIWERLEGELGVSVAAISPMNAANRTKQSPFFVPDPWTQTDVSGPASLRELYRAIAQAVGDNASHEIHFTSYLRLLWGALAHMRLSSLPTFGKLFFNRKKKPWSRAMILDRLLADVFLRLWKSHRPGFSSLFLNAGAHIQHHYMFSSAAYQGTARNPDWYILPGLDPLLEIYELYDDIINDFCSLPGNPRIMVATGLHQDPHGRTTFYYRLRNHGEFLNRIGIKHASVEPRMSRDFLIRFDSSDDASAAVATLTRLATAEGIPLFEVDNRGKDAFVTLTYPDEIKPGQTVYSGPRVIIEDLHPLVVFVAIKNGQHNGIGYFVDTGTGGEDASSFPVAEIFDRVNLAFRQSPVHTR